MIVRRSLERGDAPSGTVHRTQDQPNRAEGREHGLGKGEFEQPFVPFWPGRLYRYRRGAAAFHAHFGIRQGAHPAEGHVIDLCAVIEKLFASESQCAIGDASDGDVYRAAAKRRHYADGLLVLVNVFESAEDSDDVGVRSVTAVRLRVYDDCLQERRQASNRVSEAFPRVAVRMDEIVLPI